MPQPTPLTPSAERSLNRAAQLALADNSARVGAGHLLWALWLEESNAASVLRSLGVRRDQVELAIEATVGNDGRYDPVLTTDIVIEARQFLHRLDSTSGELTSEHLLLGLTNLAKTQLEELGVTAEGIERLLVSQPETASVPVGDEFRLGSDSSEPPESRDLPMQEAGNFDQPSAPAAAPTVLTSELDAYRTIDAAANRAREGLRVVEDLVRFSLGDRFLTEQLKATRHDLSIALSSLHPMRLLRARDTQGDAGTTISLPTESRRDGQLDILLANMKRCQEALRTLEEMTKVVSGGNGDPSGRIERTRYRSYTIEKAIATTMNSNRIFEDRRLYLLVTESICQRAWQDVVIDALQEGVDVIQLREKTLSQAELIQRGKWLREETGAADVILIVNDRADIAAEVGADGLHLGQTDGSIQDARRILGSSALVGVSTHNIEQARQAVLDGADYLGVGPVFQTKTKSFAKHAGLEYVREVAEEITLPWFAIGGINSTNVTQVRDAGAQRIAVSSAICGTAAVLDASKLLCESLRI